MKDVETMNRLSVSSIDCAVLVPGSSTGGGVFANGKYVKSAMVSSAWFPEKFWQPPENVVDSDEEVVYLGCFERCWGHCITDNLKFLWIFQDPQYAELLASHKWVYVRSGQDRALPDNFWQVLSVFGINADKMVEISRPTRFRRVWLPEESFFADAESDERFITPEYEKTIDLICERVSAQSRAQPSRKVYFSRTGWKKGNPDFGEHLIEDCFRHLGYEIIRPETLSFKEMVGLLQQCTHFASLEGSSAHNAVFLPKGANLTVIKKADYENPYQKVIDAARDLKARYVKSHRSNLRFYRNAPFGGPFYLYVSKDLSEFAGVPAHFSLWDFSKYFLCWLRFKVENFLARFPGWLKRRIWRSKK